MGSPNAIVLVGDLAFHVTSNYHATSLAGASSAPSGTPRSGTLPGTRSSGASSFLADEALDAIGSGPSSRLAVRAPAEQTLDIGVLPPTVMTATSLPAAQRHQNHDLALASLW
jgi:hypothetical protein